MWRWPKPSEDDMLTHSAKRVEIIIEAPMEGRLTDALQAAGVTGFTGAMRGTVSRRHRRHASLLPGLHTRQRP